ncbi:MAG: Oligopeptide-binding protein AppA [Firmicutes bacterium]|nr:Oligopeptide-binding protein AppA [Bacillota bacterium]
MLRKSLVGLAVLAMVATMFLGLPLAQANAPIRVTINGAPLALDVAPTIQNGRTLVPMRAIFEALGAQVHWDNPDIVRAYRREDAIVLQIGSRTAWVNGPPRPIDVPPVVIDGRTMVPLRFVAESLGAQVAWVEATRTVTVQHAPYTPPLVGGTITYGATAEPVILNPILSVDTASAFVHGLTNWGLVRSGVDLTMRNSIADRWLWDQNALTWTFWLRPDVRFSDGRPLTARDVKFTFDTIMHPDYDGVRRPTMLHVAEITTSGDHIVRFRMRQVDAPFLFNIGLGIIPYHILGNVPVREHRAHAFSRQPVGAGPYLFDRIIPGQFTVVRRNPHFWMGPRPYIETIVIRRYADLNVMQAAFEVGDIDWFGALMPDDIERVRRELAGRANFREIPAHGYDYMEFNLEHPVLRDRRVREALKLGLDRPAMINSILDGRGNVVHAHQIPTSWATGAPNLNAYAFNPARARQLLEEAGWRIPPGETLRRRGGARDGELLRLTLQWGPPGNVLRKDAAAMAVRQWRELGIDAVDLPTEWSVFLNNLDFTRYDIAIIGWALGLDPDPFNMFHSSQSVRGADGRIRGFNTAQFRNAEVDRLLEAARLTVDIAERRAMYQRVDQILNFELPYIWLWQRINVRGVWGRIGGISETPIGTAIGEALFVRDVRR